MGMSLVVTRSLALAWGVLLVGGPLRAAPTEPARTGRSPARPPCDEVCELRVQDQAFALLIEAYREFRGQRIQSQYETSMQAVLSATDESGSLLIASAGEGLAILRGWTLQYIQRDRDQQLQELHTKVAQLQTAYSCVRHVDEADVGERVPSRVDPQAAALALQNFDLIAYGSPTSGGIRLVQSVSATNFLFNIPPVEPDRSQLIQGCDASDPPVPVTP